MYKKAIFVLILLNGYVNCTSSVANSWMHFTEALKDSIKNCPASLPMFECWKHSSLKVFDKMITSNVIPLTLDVRLIRNHHGQEKSFDNDNSKHTSTDANSTERSDRNLTKECWSEHILKNIVNLSRTHTLNIDFTQRSVSGRGRHRHRDQMLPMMLFGVTALGAFTIPMGFQFLAVLGGKALLLSKMALILAMMNGLRKVASSGIHYGLYHTDQHHQHGYQHGYLDREDRPRFVGYV